MNLKAFLKLVEIQTKVASVFPFLVGVSFAQYRYHEFKGWHVLLMFISLLCVDMATTGMNNYVDFKRALKKSGYGFETHNAMVSHQLKEKHVLFCLASLLLIAISSGVYLVVLTDWLVLILGVLSFGVGIIYSYGPIPISRTPLGELFSGFFMGFVILFLSIYVNIYEEGLIIFMINEWHFSLNIDLKEMIILFLISLPLVIGIANIMLANNICDLSDDIENKRYTLPYYIGKRNALLLYKFSYYFAYVDVLILMILRILPLTMVLTLITAIPVRAFIQTLMKVQSKQKTFVVSVKSFVLLSASYLISLLLGVAIQLFL